MTLLEARGVEVRFGGLLALAGVDLDAERGQVTGLIGPNGAGKTTLFNVVSGLIDPSAGAVRLDGCDITAWPAHRRARAGVARTFQRPQLFGRLTVADNLMAGWEASRGWGALGRRRSTEGHHRVSEVIDLLGLAALADRPA
ncbi:MAG TPA: ATP-binding cassette domain-containing protein, partial [Acidimicrobiales bacterium]|nr:ATP-binding cassette domain-containing protein [Acidimicrobiales bacterium]